MLRDMALKSSNIDEMHKDELIRRAQTLLKADHRVIAVTLVGSLNQGKGDRYSDIDLRVVLPPEITDRSFAEEIPNLLAPLGPLLVEGWALRMLPDRYVRTLYFTDYPLFWHLDVSSQGGKHVDGSDLLQLYHGSRFLKTWLETLKGVLRGKAETAPGFPEDMLGRWLTLSKIDSNLSVPVRMGIYLEECLRQSLAELQEKLPPQSPYYDREKERLEAFYQRCTELHSTLLPS